VVAWVKALFAGLDSSGVPGLFPYLDEQVQFRFGSFPPERGRDRFAAAWEAMSPRVRALRHDVLETWAVDDRVICRGNVTYTLVDGGAVTVPFANFFRLRDGRIIEYLIYVDASAVLGSA